MPYVVQSFDKTTTGEVCVNPVPDDDFDDWEDVVETYGKPDVVLVPGAVWLTGSLSEPICLITLTGCPCGC